MRQLTFALLAFCFSLIAVAPSLEAGCASCLEARKNNQNKNRYFYYEDSMNSHHNFR